MVAGNTAPVYDSMWWWWWWWFWVVVAFSSLARILGECSTIHSPPALFFFFFKWRLARAHKFHSLGQDQSKWLSELRRL